MDVAIVCIVFSSIIAIIMLIDVIPILNDWIRRIKIGRYTDRKLWSISITKKGIKWINKVPKIKVTDNTRLVVIDMLKGNYTKNTIQHWQEAGLVLGISEYLKYENDDFARCEIIEFLNTKLNDEGDWKVKPKHVDVAILAYAIMKLNFIEVDKYKKALDGTWEIIQNCICEDGTVGYRKTMENYRYVDTIGFICPFLVTYGIRYQKKECVDLAMKQIMEYEKYGMLNSHYIPSHAYKTRDKIPVGLYGWGRGLGWFAIGLIDTWNELPQDSEHKIALEKSVEKFAKSVMYFQQNNGSWNWIVARNECRADSSTTAMLGWFMLHASKIKGISEECLDCADNAIKYLMGVTRRTGEVDFSQGDTKDIGVYSMLFNILPFTQGFCIRYINCYLKKIEE
ncbi:MULTISPECIES: glycoside hydrolase family 88 protein [Bacillus]|uniref:Unsaturated rhamnogalacturonyl hydrolase n=1 Tax=Bacillus cereus TaxID=1396 RepID=A0A2C1LEB1_BACCE|nr:MULTISPECIES: glycoside hydrolase family 88 protein [Bacillus]PGT96258.1 hypothetical protein COD19_28225 [Bacillus cereus]PGX01841.1 hypothetical protein COE07_26150 [Bacillus sp. AFS033286]